jgi:hypothetical protein
MGYRETRQNCLTPRTEPSGVLVLVLIGFGLTSLAFGLGIEKGLAVACVQATLVGATGILLAGLWQVRRPTRPTSL